VGAAATPTEAFPNKDLSAVGPYQSSKLWVQDLVGLSKDALHIYVGLIVLLLVAALLRAPLRDWRPIGAVLLVAVAGEIWDMIEWTRRGNSLLWPNHWHDLWNTMFWPSMLFATARWTRLLKR
jgi:hypothetical protein